MRSFAMEKAKEMKTIKLVKPFYSNHLGNGMFAGTTYVYQCKKCGLAVQKSTQSYPMGACPAGGLHSWTMTRV